MKKDRKPRSEWVDSPPPERVRCDFCGSAFKPKKWNSRTCVDCRDLGLPDQSIEQYPEYDDRVLAWSRGQGRSRPPRKKALA